MNKFNLIKKHNYDKHDTHYDLIGLTIVKCSSLKLCNIKFWLMFDKN